MGAKLGERYSDAKKPLQANLGVNLVTWSAVVSADHVVSLLVVCYAVSAMNGGGRGGRAGGSGAMASGRGTGYARCAEGDARAVDKQVERRRAEVSGAARAAATAGWRSHGHSGAARQIDGAVRRQERARRERAARGWRERAARERA